jgi:hypothetical protein
LDLLDWRKPIERYSISFCDGVLLHSFIVVFSGLLNVIADCTGERTLNQTGRLH